MFYYGFAWPFLAHVVLICLFNVKCYVLYALSMLLLLCDTPRMFICQDVGIIFIYSELILATYSSH